LSSDLDVVLILPKYVGTMPVLAPTSADLTDSSMRNCNRFTLILNNNRETKNEETNSGTRPQQHVGYFVNKYNWMDKWMDGWMDGWVGGWMDRWMDG